MPVDISEDDFNFEDDPLTEDLLGSARSDVPTEDDGTRGRDSNGRNKDEVGDDESFTEEFLLDDLRDDLHDENVEDELGISPRSDFTDQLLGIG